jgi:predicted acetyltransferase
MTGIEIVPATLDQKPLLGQLFELYQYDFSAYTGEDVDDDGRYGYPRLDSWWDDPDRHPFLLRVDGHWAGFALVHDHRTRRDMAEFFVLQKFRRGGVGTRFARAMFEQYPGAWQVREMRENRRAIAFWKEAIPVPFTDHEWEKGPMQRFTMPS